MSPDPWTSFLDWLTSVMVPAWGELIALLPFFIVLGVVGPIVTLVVLMWAWYLLRRRRGVVHHGQLQPGAAPLGAGGEPHFPANVPYCESHRLIFPPRAKVCSVDGGSLSVICPVDGTVRVAEISECSACGTRYVLGATAPAAIVISSDGPPTGGAAVA
jgi:hypothetical protein